MTEPNRYVIWRALADFSQVRTEAAKTVAAEKALEAENKRLADSNKDLSTSQSELGKTTSKSQTSIRDALTRTAQARQHLNDEIAKSNTASAQEINSMARVERALNRVGKAKLAEASATHSVTAASTKLSQAQKLVEDRTNKLERAEKTYVSTLSKGTATATEVRAAESKLTTAREQLIHATAQEENATLSLDRAQQRVLRTQNELAIAQSNVSQQVAKAAQESKLAAEQAEKSAAREARAAQARLAAIDKEQQRVLSLRSALQSAISARERSDAAIVKENQSEDSHTNALERATAAIRRAAAAKSQYKKLSDEEQTAINKVNSAEKALVRARQNEAVATGVVNNRIRTVAAMRAQEEAALERVGQTTARYNELVEQHGASSLISINAEREMVKAELDHESASVRTRNAISDLDQSERRLVGTHQAVAAAEDKLAARLRAAEREMRLAGGSGGGLITILNGLSSAFSRGGFGAGILNAALKGLKFASIGLAVLVLVQSLSALVSGLFALVSAISPAVGALAAIGPMAITAASALGTLKLAFSGIGNALKAYGQMQKAQATTSAKTADAEQAHADAIKNAQLSLRDAREQVGLTAQNVADNIAKAYKTEQDAQESVLQSQKDLSQARREAKQNVIDLRNAVIDAALAERGALLGLEDAKAALTRTLNDPTATRLQREQAKLAVDQAQRQADTSVQGTKDAQAAAEDAARKGVEGADNVVQAKKAETDAIYSLQQAQKDYTKAVDEGARQNRKAREDVTKAVEALAAAERKASTETGSAATAANNYKYALSKLTPAGRAFVEQLLAMQGYLTKLKTTAANALLPGLTKDLQRLPILFPPVNQAVGLMGAALADLAYQATNLFTSPPWIASLNTLGKEGPNIIKPFGEAFLSLLDAFRAISVAAIPLTKAIGASTKAIADHLDKIVNAPGAYERMVSWFDKSWRVAQQVGRILKNLALAFFNVGKIAGITGQGMLDSIEKLTKKFLDFTKSVEGQKSITEFFQRVDKNARAVMGLLGMLGKAFINAGASEGLAPIIEEIRTKLAPALHNLLEQFNEGEFGKKLVDLLANIINIIAKLVGDGSALNVFVTILSSFTSVLAWFVNIPGVAPAIGAIAAALAAFAAIKLIGTVTGIGKLTGALAAFLKLRKEAAVATAAGDALTFKQRMATAPVATLRGAPSERRAARNAARAARGMPTVDNILGGGTGKPGEPTIVGGRHAAPGGADETGGRHRAPAVVGEGRHRAPDVVPGPAGGGSHRDPSNERARRRSIFSRRSPVSPANAMNDLDRTTRGVIGGTNNRLGEGGGSPAIVGGAGQAGRGIKEGEKAAKGIGKLEKAGKGLSKAGKGILGALGGLLGLGPAGVLIVGAIAGLVLLYMKVKWFRDFINAAWKDIAKWSVWLWNNGIKPAFNWMKQGVAELVIWYMKHKEQFDAFFHAVAVAANWLWKYAIKPAFAGIKLLVKDLALFAKIYFRYFVDVMTVVVGAVKIWFAMVKLYFTLIKTVIVAIISTLILFFKTSWGILTTIFSTATKVIKDIMTGNFSAAWKDIKEGWQKILGYLTGAWDGLKAIAGKAFGSVSKAISSAFGSVRSALSGIWDGIKKDFETAINFVTQRILNPFIGAINSVLSHLPGGFKIPTIAAIDTSAKPNTGSPGGGGSGAVGNSQKFAFAKGGVTPGYTPGRDVHHFFSPTGGELHLSGGEGILIPEAVRALGGASGIQNINSMASRGRVRPSDGTHFAVGGVLGKLWGSVSSGVGSAVNGLRSATAWASKESLDAATAPLRALINKLPSDLIRKLTSGAFNEIGTAAYNFIKGKQPQGNTSKTSATQNSAGLNGSQMSNAEIIKAVGLAMGGSARDVQIAYMTAMVESSMRNLANPNVPESMRLPHDGTGSDHDSVGLFQQRNSWGSAAQRLNPSETSRLFYERLLGLGSSRLNMSMGQAAQTVQVSAFPDRYAAWQDFAINLYNQIGGPVNGGRPAPSFAKGGMVQKFHAGGIVKDIGPGGSNLSIAALKLQSLTEAPKDRYWSTALTTAARKRLTGVSLTNDLTNTAQPPRAFPDLSGKDPRIGSLVGWMTRAKPTTYDSLWKNNPVIKNPLFPLQAFAARPDLLLNTHWPTGYNPRTMVGTEATNYRSWIAKYRSDMGLVPKPGAYWTADMDAPSDHILAHALNTPHPADWPHPWSGPVTAIDEELAQQDRANALNTEWYNDLQIIANWGLTALVDELLDKGVADGMEIARSAIKDRATATRLNDAIVAGKAGFGGLSTTDQATILKAVSVIAGGTPTANKGLRDVAGYLQIPEYSVVNFYDKMSAQLAALPNNITAKFKSDVGLFRQGLFYANSGAIVPGQGNQDTVPAMLTPGEGVLNNMAMRLLGAEDFNKLNAGQVPQFFNSGGIVLSPNVNTVPSLGASVTRVPSVPQPANSSENKTYIANNTWNIESTTERSMLDAMKQMRHSAATGEFFTGVKGS